MRKLIALAAIFLAVFAVNANAGDLTVAKTDITLTGGISASYNYTSDTRSDNAARFVDDHDDFNVDTAVIHLFKNPTLDSPMGGHLAVGSFDVKFVTGEEVTPRINEFAAGENFRVWLGYASYMPVENLTVDAGLLWHKFGEAPITIANAHVTRPVAFMAQPVCYGGARINYDAGLAKVYVGMNDGSYLGPGHGNKDGVIVSANGHTLDNDRAYEVGASANVETLTIAANYFDHDEGYNTINCSVGVAAGMLDARVEVNYVTTDFRNFNLVGAKAKDDDAISWALYACAKLTDDFKVPVRFEIVDDMGSRIYLNPTAAAPRAGYDGWNVTVTPTFNPTPNSFIRLEGVYAEDNNKRLDDRQFYSSKGVINKRDERHAVIVEFGFLL